MAHLLLAHQKSHDPPPYSTGPPPSGRNNEWSLNPNKSAGHYNIGNFIIKKVKTEISKPLTQIFNVSLSSGVVPEKLKVAKVTRSIYKRDDSP